MSTLGVPDLTLYKASDYLLLFTVFSDAALSTPRSILGFGTPVYRIGNTGLTETYAEVNGVLQDADNGIIGVEITNTLLSNVPDGPLAHQLFITDNSGNVQIRDGFIQLRNALPAPA